MGKVGLFDLEKLFALHRTYHSNPMNMVIHMIFVWPILFTAILILYFTPSLFDLIFSLFGKNDAILRFNFGFLIASIYALFYICLDPKSGSFAALLSAFLWVSTNFLARLLGFSLAWKVVLIAQVVCWTAQFVGHGVFERRAPSVLDNFTQTLVMAPFFVLLEALHIFFGYEPYPGFNVRVQAKVEAEIRDWQEKQRLLV